MGLFKKEPYETMTDQEFVDEMIRVFDIRLSLEHAISILRDQDKGIAASDWQPKFEQQLKDYRIEETVDCSNFLRAKTLTLSIVPYGKFGDRQLKFRNELLLDGRPVSERKIKDKLLDICADMRHYSACMKINAEYHRKNLHSIGQNL